MMTTVIMTPEQPKVVLERRLASLGCHMGRMLWHLRRRQKVGVDPSPPGFKEVVERQKDREEREVGVRHDAYIRVSASSMATTTPMAIEIPRRDSILEPTPNNPSSSTSRARPIQTRDSLREPKPIFIRTESARHHHHPYCHPRQCQSLFQFGQISPPPPLSSQSQQHLSPKYILRSELLSSNNSSRTSATAVESFLSLSLSVPTFITYRIGTGSVKQQG